MVLALPLAYAMLNLAALIFQSEAIKALLDVITNPVVIKTLVFYWVFSALVSAMPSPEKVEAAFVKAGKDIGPLTMLIYQAAFGFLHFLQGNVSRAAVAFNVPGAKEDGQ